MTYAPQVDKAHYGARYRAQDRWNSYWHQLDLIGRAAPSRVLEIGPGGGTLTRELRATGTNVTTLDIAADVQPDIVGSVTQLPLEDDSFDAIAAFEVLEHIRFEDVPQAFKEIARVTRKYVIVSVPHPGYVFSAAFKIPLLPKFHIFFMLPFFWRTHRFNGEHHWEMGTRGYPMSRFVATAQHAGLTLVSEMRYIDVPPHHFFVFEKRSK